MKRLFVVGNTYFASKIEAKLFRDSHPGTHVSKGPDHKDYVGKVKTHIGSKGHSQGMRT